MPPPIALTLQPLSGAAPMSDEDYVVLNSPDWIYGDQPLLTYSTTLRVTILGLGERRPTFTLGGVRVTDVFGPMPLGDTDRFDLAVPMGAVSGPLRADLPDGVHAEGPVPFTVLPRPTLDRAFIPSGPSGSPRASLRGAPGDVLVLEGRNLFPDRATTQDPVAGRTLLKLPGVPPMPLPYPVLAPWPTLPDRVSVTLPQGVTSGPVHILTQLGEDALPAPRYTTVGVATWPEPFVLTPAGGEKLPGTGDVDGDGHLGLRDAVLALRHALGLSTLLPEQVAAADLDNNGRVDISDVLELLHRVVTAPA